MFVTADDNLHLFTHVYHQQSSLLVLKTFKTTTTKSMYNSLNTKCNLTAQAAITADGETSKKAMDNKEAKSETHGSMTQQNSQRVFSLNRKQITAKVRFL
uniref:Inositol-3-phosphate synthase n=1 Tax=Zeugodacus cucurbitae TaxID=28588 RepID=A0A0A1WZI7_ZEUCU